MTVKRKANADGAQRESQSEYGFDGIDIVEKDLRREFQRNDEAMTEMWKQHIMNLM